MLKFGHFRKDNVARWFGIYILSAVFQSYHEDGRVNMKGKV